jgi:phage terminase small subunit
MLTLKQARFLEEYLVDLNGKAAAIRAGYSQRTAEVQASQLLSNYKIRVALEDAMQARSKRTEVTADRVVAEYARIAFANMRDYLPKKGETIDLQRLDQDRTAAVEEIIIDEFVDQAGTVHRRTRVKLHDKKAALDSLAKHLGMFVDPRVAEQTFAHRVQMMTSEERRALAHQLLEDGRKLLPLLKEEDEDELAQQEGKKSSRIKSRSTTS